MTQQFTGPMDRHENKIHNSPMNAPMKQRKAKAPAKPEGHEMLLKILKDTGKTIKILTQSGQEVIGKIKATDKYTISITTEAGADAGRQRVFFKSSIECFEPIHN
jgi:sRNA-binding regulator protein Hfq